jgi:DNA-binding transcriptional LysR family regulator
LLRELDHLAPDLVVDVATEHGDGMIDGMLHGASDVALVFCAPAREDVESKLLRRDRPVAVVHTSHPLAGAKSVSLDVLARHTLVLWPRKLAKGAHDVVLSMFVGRRPASTRIAEIYSGAYWDAMLAGGFVVVSASAPVGGDFAAVPIDGAEAEFTTSMVWSRRTPPKVLDTLVEAADAAIVANRWV